MSKADGIGTWVWNSELSINSPLVLEYTFDYVSNSKTFSSIQLNSVAVTYLNSNESVTAYTSLVKPGQSHWTTDFDKIDIKTAPPADFLAILQANATYQEPKLTDLTGTTWKWNEFLPVVTNDLTFYLSFASDNTPFVQLDYLLTSSGSELMYNLETVYYREDDGWVNGGVDSPYRLISIIGGTDATNTDLINYLYANAELQGSAPSEPTYKLRINGTYARVNGKAKGSLTFGGATYKWDNTSVIGGGNA